MSPEVSEDIDVEGDVGGISSWMDDMGVWGSQVVMPVRRRFDGGMFNVGGEWPSLSSFISSVSSSEAIEERGDPGDSAMVEMENLQVEVFPVRSKANNGGGCV
jgi:hypothetical protein